MVTAAMKLKDGYSLQERHAQPRQIFKSRDITLPTKVHLVKIVFSVYVCDFSSLSTAIKTI